MQIKDNKFLQFVDFVNVKSWSSYSLLGQQLMYSQKYPFVPIGDFLKRNKTPISIKNNVLYKRATIKINGKGINLRDEIDGERIGTKNQFLISKAQFLLSKIDARNGAFGVVPDELDGGIITGNFWTFSVDYKLINPFYLTLLTGTKEFQKLCQSASVGTTNRNYLQERLFLDFEIPLPTLSEQEELVKAYNQKMSEVEYLSTKANDLEGEIEKYFLQQLGLNPFLSRVKKVGLFTINFFELDRWDFFSGDARINSPLSMSKYPINTIGSAFVIAKRPWKKKSDKNTFKYIEIGAIDPSKGILNAKEILISKAPSRATQTIKEGDLIIGTTRPYLKKFAIVTAEYDNDVCSSGFTVIEKNKKYHLPYLLQFLRCVYGVEQLKNKMTGGLYPAITESELKTIRVPLPEVSKQIEIMELIKQKEKEIQAGSENIDILRQQGKKDFEQAIFG
jgi:restriction endonuclease S subunit